MLCVHLMINVLTSVCVSEKLEFIDKNGGIWEGDFNSFKRKCGKTPEDMKYPFQMTVQLDHQRIVCMQVMNLVMFYIQ